MKTEEKTMCGCWLLLFLFNIALGGWSVDVILKLFGEDVAWYWDVLLGLIVAEISVPVALVVTILQWAGVL